MADPIWVGLASIRAFPRHRTYILGELHGHGHREDIAKSPDHAIYRLPGLFASGDHPILYIELTDLDEAYIDQTDRIRNRQGLRDLYHDDFMASMSTIERAFHKRIFREPPFVEAEYVYCNVRNSVACAPMWLLAGIEQFKRYFGRPILEIRHGPNLDRFLRGVAKRFERSLSEHVRTGEDMVGLWLQILLPDRSPPEWYQNTMDEIDPRAPNRVKEVLATLATEDRASYVKLVEFFEEYFSHDVPPLHIVQDLYTVAAFLLKRRRAPGSGPHIFLVGESHARFLEAYFEQEPLPL